ncbi:hypothetical protein DMC01_12615, partial [Campylobacter troglodytis]
MLSLNERKNAKRIRIFAYIGNANEVMYANTINLKTNKTKDTKNRVERIYCVELKILQNRFSLFFDGEHLRLYENERLFYHNNKPCIWDARSSKASKAKMQDRLCVKFSDTENFYYDTALQKNKQVVKEGDFFVKFNSSDELTFLELYETKDCVKKIASINELEFNLEYGNINLGTSFLSLIQTLKELNMGSIIPLKISYKKRILIHIKRILQSTRATKAEFSMYIDGKKWEFQNSKKIKTSKAYVLERPGPDCITPNLELRIPEGRYNVAWHTNSNQAYKNKVLKLYNDNVLQARAILIHSGKNAKNSRGCLLLEEKLGKENELERGISIIKALQNTFNDKGFKDKFENMPKTAEHMMVMVENEFESTSSINTLHKNKEYYIDDEGYLHWEVYGVDKIKRAKDIWKKLNYEDQTKQLKEKLKQGNLTKEQIKAIVLHRTDSTSALQAINSFLNKELGTHFLIDKDGTIYQCASLHKWTRHIGDIKARDIEINGKNSKDYSKYKNKTYKEIASIEKRKSYPTRYPINNDSIGIEVVGKCYNDKEKKIKIGLNYTQYNGKWEEAAQEQKVSIKHLVDILKAEY